MCIAKLRYSKPIMACPSYLRVQILDRRMAAAQGYNPQALSSLDSQIAEVEDMLSYISDILATGGWAAVARDNLLHRFPTPLAF